MKKYGVRVLVDVACFEITANTPEEALETAQKLIVHLPEEVLPAEAEYKLVVEEVTG